jgi:hypothetical protein
MTALFSADPDLAAAPVPGRDFNLENSALLAVQIGDLNIRITGADGLIARVTNQDFYLRGTVPPAQMPFATPPITLEMILQPMGTVFPRDPFDRIHVPSNLEVLPIIVALRRRPQRAYFWSVDRASRSGSAL